MEVKKLTWSSLTGAGLSALLDMSLQPTRERKYREVQALFTQETVYGIEHDGALIAASASAQCPYLSKAVMLRDFRYAWAFNREEALRSILSCLAAFLREEGCETLVLSIDRTHDLNRSLYRSVGFADLLFPSPDGTESVLIVVPVEKMIGFDT